MSGFERISAPQEKEGVGKWIQAQRKLKNK